MDDLELTRAMLFERARRGDADARRRLVESFRPLARCVAIRMRTAWIPDVEDRMSLAFEGVVLAIDSWDPLRGRSLKSYVIEKIKRAILDRKAGEPKDPMNRAASLALNQVIKVDESRHARDEDLFDAAEWRVIIEAMFRRANIGAREQAILWSLAEGHDRHAIAARHGIHPNYVTDLTRIARQQVFDLAHQVMA